MLEKFTHCNLSHIPNATERSESTHEINPKSYRSFGRFFTLNVRISRSHDVNMDKG